MQAGDGFLGRLIRLTFVATWTSATLGTFLMVVGSVSVPLAGWGAAYVFAGGLWILVFAALLAVCLLFGAVLFRATHGHWYFGASVRSDQAE
jgi:hypothetical protein